MKHHKVSSYVSSKVVQQPQQQPPSKLPRVTVQLFNDFPPSFLGALSLSGVNMAHPTSPILLGLVTLGTCSPFSIPILSRDNGDGKDDNLLDPIEYCESHKNLATYADAKKAWDETGAGVSWDIRLGFSDMAAGTS